MEIPVMTSEDWHKERFGLPDDCYRKYLEKVNTETWEQILAIEDKTELIRIIDKWAALATIFPFKDCKYILDLGSNGSSSELLLALFPHIKKIIAIDGDYKSQNKFKSIISDKIIQMYFDFYEFYGMTTIEFEYNVDTILMIDIAEHLPDDIFEKLVKWSLSLLDENGKIFLYTPDFPNASDQLEHISVKNMAYYIELFRDKLKCKVKINNRDIEGRIFAIIQKS